MGNGERQGRRALNETARQAVQLANECNEAVAGVQLAHNALTGQVSTDMAEIKATQKDLKKRADGQRAWLQQVDARIANALQSVNSAHSTLQHQDRSISFLLHKLTFRERLRFVLFGEVPLIRGGPQPPFPFHSSYSTADPMEPASAAPQPDSPEEKQTAMVMPEPRQPLTGYIPHTSQGPAVLP